MAGRLSCVDAVSPAFERTKKQLFGPFRFKHWLRLAVVCFLTGEVTGGGGGGFRGINFNLPPPHGGRGDSYLTGLPGWMSRTPLEVIAWVAFGVIALILLILVFIYVSSVFRFILFDAVLNNRCSLRAGWRNWQRQGSSYFLWQIGFGMASLAALGAVVGIPVLAAWRAGYFSNSERHILALVIGGFAVFMLFFIVMVLSAVGSLFTKDFVVPVMALEGHGALDGWRRLLPMLGQEKGAYALYVLMKIVLAIGSALLFGIIEFLVIFVMVIGAGLAGVAIFLVAKGAGITWNPLTIGLTIVAGGAVLLLLLAVTTLISTPAMVFFQAYSIHFFGSRYPVLETAMSPPDASPPALPPSAVPEPAA
jgi:hypothetical protein